MSTSKTEVECPKCGLITQSDKGFCPLCGTFLLNDFEQALVSPRELVLKKYFANLKRIPHRKINNSAILSTVVNRLEDLQAVCRVPYLYAQMKDVENEIQVLLTKYTNSEFHVAFVGTIKTGKSTLINALLGADYASVAVTPETAVLTKFKYSDHDFVDLKFYTHEEWDKLWKSRSEDRDTFSEEYYELGADKIKREWLGHPDIHIPVSDGYCGIKKELSKWSSSKHAEHYFVKEITVGISKVPKYFPKNVVIVDTPGLSDPVQYRSEISYNYIRRANAVFVCIEAKKIQREEISTLSSVFTNIGEKNTDCVHVIATHWDQLNHPEQDWEQNKEFMSKKLAGHVYFGSYEVAKTNIIHSSAYMYNLISKYINNGIDASSQDGRTEIQNLFNFAKNIEHVMAPILPTDDQEDFMALANKFKDKEQDLFNRLRKATNIDYIRKEILYQIIACKSFRFVELQAVSDLETICRKIQRVNDDVVLRPLMTKLSLLTKDFDVSDLKAQKKHLADVKSDCEKMYNQLNKYLVKVSDKTKGLLKKLHKADRKK
jgi:GTPase SAR1 family protein